MELSLAKEERGNSFHPLLKEMLGLPGALVFRAGFNRPNLHYSVLPKPKDKVLSYSSL